MKNRKPVTPSQSVENARKAMINRNKKRGWDPNLKYYCIIGAFVLIMIMAVFYLKNPKQSLLTKKIIDQDEFLVHNSQNQHFTVGPNEQFKGMTMSEARRFFSIGISPAQNLPSCEPIKDVAIPENYDFRFDELRKDCVDEPRMTGNCTAGHVLAVLSTIEDRICIQNEGKERFRLSAQDVVSCDATNYQCDGGYVTNTLDYGQKRGFIREEWFAWEGRNSTCPDEVNPCRENKEQYQLLGYCAVQGPDAIKREILKNGPVIAPLVPYTDFLTYKKGVYFPSEYSFKFNGQQAIKIVGWQKSMQGDSWIIENTWGSQWGDNGYANVISGHKDLGIDYIAISPTPIPVPYYKFEQELQSKQEDEAQETNAEAS